LLNNIVYFYIICINIIFFNLLFKNNVNAKHEILLLSYALLKRMYLYECMTVPILRGLMLLSCTQFLCNGLIELSWRIVTHVCLCAAVSATVQVSHWGNVFLQKEKGNVNSVVTAHCLVTSPVAQALCSHFVFTLVPIVPKLWLN
jgi:hypothetical protein